jgi:hypothetical protein
MPEYLFPPLTKVYPFFGPGQWGVQGADRALGLRLDTRSNIFYVDSGHARANDNNDGTDPDNPLFTVTTGLARAVTNNNDYVVVRQMTNASETFPITITKNRVHLISTFYRPGHGPEIRPTGVTAGLLVTADNVEVAGFEINAGDNTQDCVTFSTVAATWGADIHHCRFGFQMPGRDGINMAGAVDKPHFTIHDNWFNDKLVRTGIRIEQNSTRSEFWGNQFRLGANANIGIHLATGCTDVYAIHDNVFRVADNAATGEGIFCVLGSTGCMIWGNQAMEGRVAMAQNPYRDLGTNNWGLNYYGLLAIMPLTA